MKVKYVHPYTNYGFKKLFGEEAGKNLLIDFLNQVLPSEHKIARLTFNNTEQLIRKCIIDILCENEKGDRFIVEMQKEKLKFFKDRAVFYTTFPIKEQAEKGDWDFKLTPIYCVAILDFTFDEDREEKTFLCLSPFFYETREKHQEGRGRSWILLACPFKRSKETAPKAHHTYER